MNGETGSGLPPDDGFGRVFGGTDQAESRFLTILNTMPQAVWSGLRDGYHDYYNDRWYEFTGAARGATDGNGWREMCHPADQARVWDRWRHSVATGEPYESEYRLRHRSGEYRWTLGRALPIRGATGAIERWFGTCTDIHDLKVAEEQRALIARELSHRIKNIFAVVASLITLSARTMPQAGPFAKSVRARIDALAHAHDYVRPQNGETLPSASGQTVMALIDKVLAAYKGSSITIGGDDTPVGVTAATSIALVVHELATNAIKYGALSSPAGGVSIRCAITNGTCDIIWQETGGPAIAQPPTTQGFGTVLSQRSVTSMHGATIAHEWRPTGLVVRIAVPTAQLAR